MTEWIVVAPQRPGDVALVASAWIASETARSAPRAPALLTGAEAVRAGLEDSLTEMPGLSGLAFFGHGAADRLFDADRPPGGDGPALLDQYNIGRLSGWWVHAFACWSGSELAHVAVERGVSIYVGYRRPINAGLEPPPSVAPQAITLLTSTTLALLQGERDEVVLRRRAAQAADNLVAALSTLPYDGTATGFLACYVIANQLVDDMVVARR